MATEKELKEWEKNLQAREDMLDAREAELDKREKKPTGLQPPFAPAAPENNVPCKPAYLKGLTYKDAKKKKIKEMNDDGKEVEVEKWVTTEVPLAEEHLFRCEDLGDGTVKLHTKDGKGPIVKK